MAHVDFRIRDNAAHKSGLETSYWKNLFWDYRQCRRLEDIPGPVRAQRYADYWPQIHFAYKDGRLNIQDIKNIVETIHRFGPVKYSEPVREYVIKKLKAKWFNE